MADTPEVLPLDAVAAIRHPKVLFTEAYLDDPIQFNTDVRFDLYTTLRQVTTTPLVNRDLAEFLTIDVNSSEPAAYPIPMYSHVISRADYNKVIDRTIRSLPRGK